MTKLGIIGGAGPLASALFYEALVQECYHQQKTLPETLLVNFPFTRGLTPQESQSSGALLGQELRYCISLLEREQVARAVLICNTLHLELAHVSQRSIPFLPIPECVVNRAASDQARRLLLLATQNTCRSSLYTRADIQMILPSAQDQRVVDQVIDNVLEGSLCAEDSQAIARVIAACSKRIDGVILGCTDLPVLHHHYPIQCQKTIYDSVKIPAQTLVRSL